MSDKPLEINEKDSIKVEDSIVGEVKLHRQLNCFIIMPFSEAVFEDIDGVEQTLDDVELRYIYEELFVKAVKSYNNYGVSFVNVHRSNASRGNFVKDIVSKLQDYDLVIADLTGLNPNVFYELGIRHTLTNGTIMLTQNIKYLPSDLGNYIGAEYKFHKETVEFTKYYLEFEKKLHRLIDDVLEEPNKIDNPVREFIGDRVIFRKEERIKEIVGNIELMKWMKEKYLSTIDGQLKDITELLGGNFNIALYTDSLLEISVPFLNRLVGLSSTIEVMAFLENLNAFLKITNANLKALKKENKIISEMIIRKEIAMLYYDRECHSYHLLELKEFYEYNDDRQGFICINPKNEPILKSFEYFIDKWKKELEELTKQ